MRSNLVFAAVLFALLGCGKATVTGEGDAGTDSNIEFDSAGIDLGRRTDMAVVMSDCGNGTLEPGEACDDGNTTDNDGCDGECRREAYCGDGTKDADEVCDDGNNASGDGCRGDCQSDETCNNGVRDFAAGEVCDDGDATGGPCSADCTMIMGCGDMDVTPPEECDDMNTTYFDGCRADCRVERSLFLDQIQIGGRTVGCDFSGDGVADNAIATALGPLGVAALNVALNMGGITALLDFEDVDDLANDPLVRTAVLNGSLNMGDVTYCVDSAQLDPTTGAPTVALNSSITAGELAAGPEDISLGGSGLLPISLRLAEIHGTLGVEGNNITTLTNGTLCGSMSGATLALVGNPNGLTGALVPPSCDGTGANSTFLDVIVGGGTISGFVSVMPTQPDVDVDGDGLEYFEVVRTGPPNCQAVISACIDGDGTRVPGAACALDPRFADGFSAGMVIHGTHATISGVCTAMPVPAP